MHTLNRRNLLISSAAGTAVMLSGIQPRAQSSDKIRFGLTPVFLTNDIDLLDRLKTYLSFATGYEVELVQRRTYQEVTSLLISGAIDAAWICGFPYIKNQDRLSLVSVPIWNGRPLYQAYVIAGKERAVNNFDDIRGDIHAFSDPDSNSGYLVTRALLTGMKERPKTYFTKSFFTYGHRNVVRAVASGLAGSGSVDGYIWEVMAEREPALVNQTKVIRKSEWLGFPPVACARQSAGEEKIKRLIEAFKRMDESEDGRVVLNLLGLDGFGLFPPSLFDGIAEKINQVESG